MSAVLCLPACLRVRCSVTRGHAPPPPGNGSIQFTNPLQHKSHTYCRWRDGVINLQYTQQNSIRRMAIGISQSGICQSAILAFW